MRGPRAYPDAWRRDDFTVPIEAIRCARPGRGPATRRRAPDANSGPLTHPAAIARSGFGRLCCRRRHTQEKSAREKSMTAWPISLRTWHLAGVVLLALPQVAAAQAS